MFINMKYDSIDSRLVIVKKGTFDMIQLD